MSFVPLSYRSEKGRALLLRDDAEAAKLEEDLRAQLEDIRQVRRIMRKYKVALGLDLPVVDLGQSRTPLADSPTRSSPPIAGSWRSFIAAALADAGRSLSHPELLATAAGTPFEQRFKAAPNTYYNTTKQMQLAGEIVKLNKRMYDPLIYAQIQDGTITDTIPMDDLHEGIPHYVLMALKEHGGSLTYRGIRNALLQYPPVSSVAELNPGLISSNLLRMVRNALIKKVGIHYRLF